ncbi:MAG: lactate dehydrogenase [Nitrosopumilaceae archaeon]|uniref:Lactate dehydrogenase n=1 Tax=Candidatus Nitrosomaritimum aestuariumsis TaxID=3342354 RepID=A0AC60W269_9ARCH|nr:lactate dehydrogenase [Nitrosopumilaceae archaeon]
MISIIGSGLVGSSIAFLCAANALDDIILLNRTKSKALGEALDISNAIPKNSDITIKGTDDYSEISNSEIIVITASTGVYLKNRNEMVDAQVKMIKDIANEIKINCKSPTVLIISNPVDVLTYFFIKETGFSRERVIGIASALDSSRFRYLLSKKIGVNQSQISDAFVLGEHGDSMVPIFSNTKIEGKNVLDIINSSQKEEITKEIRDYWKSLRNFKSRSQFGISKSTFDAIYSILNNQPLLSPTSILLDGEYDQKNVCMGVLTTIGSKGVSKIHQTDVDESEKKSLDLSAQTIRNNIESI